MPKLKNGDAMPDFTYDTGWKTDVQLKDACKGRFRTVFWVLRYIGCPTCRLTSEYIKEQYDRFLAKNAQVIMVMQSDQAHIQKEFGSEDAMPFEFVCDPQMKIYKELDIKPAASKEEMRGNGDPEAVRARYAAIREQLAKYGFSHGDYEGDELQLPAIFILNEDANVVYAHYAENSGDMPGVEEVLAMLPDAPSHEPAKLRAGDKFPSFTYDTAWEDGKNTDDLFAKADKTVFWVLRYLGCTVCRLDVEMVKERYEEFRAKGAQVCFLMQSDKAHGQAEFGENRLPFDLILDNKLDFYQSLKIESAKNKQALLGNLANLGKLTAKGAKCAKYGFSHGDFEGDELQLPAMFIVGRDGTVLDAHYAENIMDMPVIDEVLAKL
ncbi:MAG: redoxin family protein [Firmicutes bacterium]|nr:redoxin family protein [Bacillota bacterium]